MALWMHNGELIHSNGSLSYKPSEKVNFSYRFFYKVPYSNVGSGGLVTVNGKRYHTPSWTEVHPETTMDDIIVEKNPFDELFVEPKTWKFKSASSDKEYTVRMNAKGNLSCDCWGYIAHRKCRHIKEVTKLLQSEKV